MKLNDNSILNFGKTFNKNKLSDVPAWHLLWIRDNCKNAPKELLEYIEENLDFIQEEFQTKNFSNNL